jgi:hypothetical protein
MIKKVGWCDEGTGKGGGVHLGLTSSGCILFSVRNHCCATMWLLVMREASSTTPGRVSSTLAAHVGWLEAEEEMLVHAEVPSKWRKEHPWHCVRIIKARQGVDNSLILSYFTIYYWFWVGEGTLQIHHLNSNFTPNPKNKLLKIVHKLITVRQKRQPHNQSLLIRTTISLNFWPTSTMENHGKSLSLLY